MAMKTTRIEVILSPAEFPNLAARDLSKAVCVVFDILRATSSMVTALGNGAAAIIPVGEIQEAIAVRQGRPDVLLAGEREGVRIRGHLAGGMDFDLGNSPREFTPEKVRGKTIVMTTTNGTRALRACVSAKKVLVGSFLNLRVTYQYLLEECPSELILICSGTYEEPALEDILAAGAICEKVWPHYAAGHVSDAAELARRIYPLMQYDLLGALKYARNGRRLLSNRELRGDVAFCVQREILPFLVEMRPDGSVQKAC